MTLSMALLYTRFICLFQPLPRGADICLEYAVCVVFHERVITHYTKSFPPLMLFEHVYQFRDVGAGVR